MSKTSLLLAVVSAIAATVIALLFTASDISFDFFAKEECSGCDASFSIASNSTSVPYVTLFDHTYGPSDAPITWIEYGDFECPYCKKFYPVVEQVLSEYSGSIRFVYRHFPSISHSGAEMKATAVECASELAQDYAFWQMHNLIFENTDSYGTGLDAGELNALASSIGIDNEEFEECIESDKFYDKITQDIISGTRLGVEGTPTSIFIGSDGSFEKLSGAAPYEEVAGIINEMLEK